MKVFFLYARKENNHITFMEAGCNASFAFFLYSDVNAGFKRGKGWREKITTLSL